MSDSVEHPSHYNAGGVETIEGIKAALGDGFSDYCLGNVLKYAWRCKHKGKLVEDLRKAAKYLEWAIEAAESNCLEIPDSSRAEPLAIPDGWRELEPDEMPLATDMHEWMGGWFYRKDDATREYKWHSSRHIRKVETPKPEQLAIPEGWRELEASETPLSSDMYEHEGMWRKRLDDANCEYEWYDVRHIRKIETANPSEIPNSSIPDPLNCIGNICDLAESTGVTCPVDSCDLDTGCRQAPAYHIPDATKTANPSKTPNSSIPDPGPGYRLLSKEPPERVIRGDEFWQNFNREWVESENFIHEGGPQSPELYYRRKIEPAAWIPKVGDRVRVNKPGRIADGKVGVIVQCVEGDAWDYAVRLDRENLTSFNLRSEHLELIEAAS